jgi:hypothetical protein
MNDLSTRKLAVEKKIITKASASLFCDQIEKAKHPFYGTRRILERGRVLRLPTTLFGCGRLGSRVPSWKNSNI